MPTLTTEQLRERAAQAYEAYRDCTLCAHRCHVDRTRGPAGRCSEGDTVYVAGAGVHFGEEPPLVGTRGSGLVLIAGCNLACSACETAEFSLQRRGVRELSASQLGALLVDLQRKGAANVNFVTPTHVLPALVAGIAEASARGCELPVVWNCGGYETREALRLVDGVVDVYLPDAKYGSDAAGEQFSGARGYPAALRESLAEMQRQTGAFTQQDGVATRGVLVRHLVLPGDAARSETALRIVAEAAPDAWVNVLSQYRPVHEASKLPVLSRRPTRDEIQAAVRAAVAAGVSTVLLDGRPVLQK